MQVSELINCGVYVFTPEIFSAIQDVSRHREDKGLLHFIMLPIRWFLAVYYYSIHYLYRCKNLTHSNLKKHDH